MIRTHYKIEDHDPAHSCLDSATLQDLMNRQRDTIHIITGGIAFYPGSSTPVQMICMAICTSDDYVLEIPFPGDDFITFFSNAIDQVVISEQRTLQ